MANITHRQMTGALNGIHVPFAGIFANAAARTGATGFVVNGSTAPFVAGDVGKLALQSDTNVSYRLTSTTPTWIQVIEGDANGTLPVVSGANITSLNASNLASGTIPGAVFPGTLPVMNGGNLTSLNATNLTTGNIPISGLPNAGVNGISQLVQTTSGGKLPVIDGSNLTNLPILTPSYSSTATTGGTTTLIVTSNTIQVWTGGSAQTIVLPTTTVVAGQFWQFVNQSTGQLTIQSSGLNTILILAANTTATFTAQVSGPTTAANWAYVYNGVNVATGKVAAINNNLTLAGTDATTMTFPPTSATIARIDLAQTFTGHNTFEGVTPTGATGTGNLVFSTSPAFTTPAIDIPSSGTLTNCTGLPLAGMVSQARPFNNFIINSDMRFAQRFGAAVTNFSTTDIYGSDRWRLSYNGASVFSHQRKDTNGVLEAGLNARYYSTYLRGASGTKLLICQPLESVDTAFLRGRTIVCQAKLKATTSLTLRFGLLELPSGATVDTFPANIITVDNAASTDPTFGGTLALSTTSLTNVTGGSVVNSALNCSATTSWTQFAFKVTVGTTYKNLCLAVWTDAALTGSNGFSISEVGLYDGDSLRDWLPNLYQVELAKSQRFFCKSYPVDTLPPTASIGGYVCGPASSTTSIRTGYHFPVEMRATPTMTIYSYAGTASKVTVSGGGDTGAAAIGNDIATTGSGSTTDAGAPYVAGTVYFFHMKAESEL